jgi:ATP-dependent helicase HrpB
LLFDKARALGFATGSGTDVESPIGRWLERRRHAHEQDPSIALLSDAELDDALHAYCEGRVALEELSPDEFFHVLAARHPAPRLAEISPERLTLPSGRVAAIEYHRGREPFVASYLQDFCGLTESPKRGRAPLLLHLLAPNKQAVQITTDLAGFWSRHYPDVRRELMRKYPKHAWPENPLVPVPMKRRR